MSTLVKHPPLIVFHWLSVLVKKNYPTRDAVAQSIADGLSDLNKLETYVNKVTQANAPSTSTARATTGKAGEFGGYTSIEEFASYDPNGAEKYLKENTKGYIK